MLDTQFRNTTFCRALLLAAILALGGCAGGYHTTKINGNEKVYRTDEQGNKQLVYEVDRDGNTVVHDASDPMYKRYQAEQQRRQNLQALQAQRIERRLKELSVAAMEQRYEALRSGEPQNVIDQLRDGSATLRAELGDADYERYLEATGRPTRVGVTTVLSSSAAETSGMQPGDQIVAYGGERVFDVRELNQVLLEGEPGEPVVVDIERDGQPIQLVIPRGPLGISSGFSRRLNR